MDTIERVRGKSIDPIFGPKQLEKIRVQIGLEIRNLKRVVKTIDIFKVKHLFNYLNEKSEKSIKLSIDSTLKPD